MDKLLILISIIAAGFMAGCKSDMVDSQWRSRPIAINGNASDWNGLMQATEDSKLGIGLVNDSASLYLCLTSADRIVTATMLRYGFTAWFKCRSQKGSRFGVHFPIGMGVKSPGAQGEHGAGFHHDMMERMQAAAQSLEVLGPGKDDTVPMMTRIADSFGIAARIEASNGNCFYELKVPLNPDSLHGYAIGAGIDSVVEIQLIGDGPEPQPASSEGNEGGSGGMGGGGMGGGGHGGGGGGGMGHLGNTDQADPVNQAITVKLARSPLQR